MEDEDELGESLTIDISSLSDDPIALKGTIRKILDDNRAVRKEAGKRRTAVKGLQGEIETLKSTHQKALDAAKSESSAQLTTELEKLRGEHKSAFEALAAERDGVVTERDGLKAERETLNRSNGQLRSKFREQFVDQRVRNELEKRGAHSVDDAMKLLDVAKFEFDEEKLDLKDPSALTTALDTFATDKKYLFGAPRAGARGTTPGRGASDNAGVPPSNSSKAFDNDSASIDDITRTVIAGLGITA